MKSTKTGLKILILDDDAVIRQVLENTLGQDFNLAFATSYREFRELLPGFKPQILFLDLVLPDGDGMDICEEVRNDGGYDELVIFMITSSYDEKTIEKGYKLGANDFIRKPFLPFEVNAKVANFEQIILNRRNFQRSIKSMESHIRRLNSMNRFIQQSLGRDDYPENEVIADKLNSIFPSHYIEIVGAVNGKHETEFEKRYDEKLPAKSYGEIAHHIDITRLSEKPVTLKMKIRGTVIHITVTGIFSNNLLTGLIVIESVKPVRKEDREILPLFSDFMTLMRARLQSDLLLKERNREYRTEISKIRKIQSESMPDFSSIKEYDISATYLPSQELSGDFFDAYSITDNVYQVVLCDVSGHGIASSYIGNEVRTIFKTYSTTDSTPASIMKSVNNAMFDEMRSLYYFCTVFICHLNLKKNTVTYTNAGHPPAILVSGKKEKSVTLLSKTGPLVGIIKDSEFTEDTITMKKGDSLLLYTDGITESTDNRMVMYGVDRLRGSFLENQGYQSRDIIHLIVSTVYEFTDYKDQEDDITAICFKKN